MCPRLGLVTALLVATAASCLPGEEPITTVRMSVHNRLLWNRAVVNGAPRIEVLLLTDTTSLDRVAAAAARLDGRIGRRDSRIGYLRLDLPTSHLLALVSEPGVDAWHISSQSRKAWYRDGPPVANATMYRGFEILAPPRAVPEHPIDKPMLTVEVSRASGYTADEDSGLAEWRRRYPTFDGRGVTIAIVEQGLLDFGHPAFGSALTLDGHDVSKIAGIVNAIDSDSYDQTRVMLDTEVRVTSSWTRVGPRTFMFPRPGVYRFGIFSLGAGGNLVQQFGVAEDATSGELRVDADGDGDFRNDPPMSDVNERFEVRELIVQPPPVLRMPFLIARGERPRSIHVYPAVGSHVTMTASVAAASRNSESLSTGVAPNARLLLVRVEPQLRDYVEAYLAVGPREEVDIISDSNGVTLLPETGDDFMGRFLTRIGETYHKVILHSANNTQLILNSASTPGSVLSIGGTMGPATFATLYGGKIDEIVVHPVAAAGPGMDGSIRPDVIAPFHVVSADLRSKDNGIGLPSTRPTARLPAGYQISCCTSASCPYAAGLTALLVSAAKQTKAGYSHESLSRAIRFGARFLASAPAYQQGNGVFDVNAAWRELNRPIQDLRLRSTSTIVHPLALYAAAGTTGSGLLEREGWRAGMSSRRTITLQRQSGPPEPTTYRLTWSGNDGTFAAPPSIALPLNTPVDLPIDVAPRTPGAHSALVNLYDSNDDLVFRTQATVVAAHELDPRTHRATVSGTIPTMRERSEYFRIPENASALTVTLRATRGRVRTFIVPAHGVYPNYYWHEHPAMTPPLDAGTYVITLARPLPGVWTVSLINDATRREQAASDDPVDYSLEVSTSGSSMIATRGENGSFDVHIRDVLQTVAEPLLSSAVGTATSTRAELPKNGLPHLLAIDVPAKTGMLMVRARGENGLPIDAHLYDCTTGECFSHTFTMPARAEQSIAVRRPIEGRWVVAINSAPAANASMHVFVDTILTGEGRTVTLPGPMERGTQRRANVPVGTIPAAPTGMRRVVLFELVDGAMAREEAAHPWEDRPNIPRLADRPVAIGTYIWSDERLR